MCHSISGTGYCMGTMYWQFNDLWQAPTWSTIEFMSLDGIAKGGKWKLAHYFIKNAYARIILSPVLKRNYLEIYAISDLDFDFNGRFTLELFSFHEFSAKLIKTLDFKVAAYETAMIFSFDLDFSTVGCESRNCFLHFDSQNDLIQEGGRNFIFLNNKIDLDNLKKSPHIKFTVKKTDDKGLFWIGLESDAIALFVYLDMNTTEFYGVFSENGFHMTKPRHVVMYRSQSMELSVDEVLNNLIVQSLADMYF